MAHSSGRKSKRQKPDPNQLIIPFDKADDIRVALNSIDHQVAGTSPNLMAQVREVVMAVWLCGRENGCRAHRATLLRVANSNQRSGTPVIGSLAAFKRALKEAARLGIITSHRSSGPSERRVDEDRIKELVELSRAPKRRSPGEPLVSRQCAIGEPSVSRQCAIGEPRPLLYPNHQTSKPNQSSETSSSSSRPTLSPEEEEVFLRLVLRLKEDGVIYAAEAINEALSNGCTLEQLRCRASWFRDNKRHWPDEARGRTLKLGIAKAVPGLKYDKGWGETTWRTRV